MNGEGITAAIAIGGAALVAFVVGLVMFNTGGPEE